MKCKNGIGREVFTQTKREEENDGDDEEKGVEKEEEHEDKVYDVADDNDVNKEIIKG